MKKTHLFLAVAGIGILSLGPVFASEVSGQSAKPEQRESHEPADRLKEPAHGSLLHGHGIQVVPQHAKIVAPKSPITTNPNLTSANGLPQIGTGRTAEPSKAGLSGKFTGTKLAKPVNLPIGRAPAASAAFSVRNKGMATTAAIGGSAAPNAKTSAAAVNGTTARRKP